MTLNRIATAICASIVLSATSMSSYAADAYALNFPAFHPLKSLQNLTLR